MCSLFSGASDLRVSAGAALIGADTAVASDRALSWTEPPRQSGKQMQQAFGLIIAALIIAAALVYQVYAGAFQGGMSQARYEIDAADDGRVVWVLDRLRGTLDGCAVVTGGEVVCASDDRSERADSFHHILDASADPRSLALRRLDDQTSDPRLARGISRSPFRCFIQGQMKICRLRSSV